MEALTIGQRIAAKRKELGLSQIDLGERVGVSRQSVSKWEADAAIPEIDKLIALSKIYGVSVGWLLGVEAPAVPAGEAFTEDQLRLMEKAVHRRHAVPRWQKAAMVCGGLLCALALLLPVMDRRTQNARIAELTAHYTAAQTRLDEIAVRLDALQNAQTEPQQNPQPELLAEYSFSGTMRRFSTVTVTFTGVPRSWNPHDRACLLIYKGEELFATEEAHWDGTTLTAARGLGSYTDYRYALQVTRPDGTKLHQWLQASGYEDIRTAKNFFIEGGIHRWHQEAGKLILDDFDLAVQYPIVRPEGTWTQVELVLVHEYGSLEDVVWSSPLAELLATRREYAGLTQPVTAGEMDQWNILRPVLAPVDGHFLIEMPIPQMNDADALRLELRCVYEYRTERDAWTMGTAYPLLRCTWRDGALWAD